MKRIKELLRKNILSLKKYSSARDEFSSADALFFDANENPYSNGFNRYPDPQQRKLKEKISLLKDVPANNILLGNGSDEILDIVIRAFCNPKKDNIIITPPTYGMYEVLADINDVEIRRAYLEKNFDLSVEKIEELRDENTKLIILCSPNNPTGNSFSKSDIEYLLRNLGCMILIDEAYIDFSENESWLKYLTNFPNLIVTQTLSKAWGLAALRVGICYASDYLISIFNKIKAPYNINLLSQITAIEKLADMNIFNINLSTIKKERELLKNELFNINFVEKIYPSNANFLLLKVTDSKDICKYLIRNGFVIRDRSSMPGCDNCIRITVGTPEENKKLISQMKKYKI